MGSLSFEVNGQTYEQNFFYDYHKIVLEEWDKVDTLMPFIHEFHKPVNKWLADQNSNKRLHFANKSKSGMAYRKDEFGLIILTEESVKAWGQNTYFLSRKILIISSIELIHLNIRLSMTCLLYTSPSPRDATLSRMPSSA